MKKSFLVAFVGGSLFMISCTEDVYNPHKVKNDYEQNFVELFGEINPNQDWNVADLKSVTVDPGTETEVKIYAKSRDVYKLVGNYQNVSGAQTLTFDAAKTVDDFYVVAGGQGKPVKNGESVSFVEAETRSYEYDKSNVFTINEDYRNFSWNDVMTYANKLPDDKHNIGVDGLSTDFNMIMGSQTITVYPVYWNATFNHTLGIYWYEGSKLRTQDIYTDKEGNDVQVWVNWNSFIVDAGWSSVEWDNFVAPERNSLFGISIKGKIDTSKGINSRGFTLDLPYGTRYGFYVKVNKNSWGKYDAIYYTDANLNDDKRDMAAYFKQEMENGTTRTFVGFEDQAGDVRDLNDLMLMIDPSPIVIDNDVQEWIIAAEDLGATDDYDFNDVVFSVKHASGQSTATVTPLAAGGSKETYLYRNGVRIGDSEFHILLGGSMKEDGTYSFVNTESVGAAGNPITIDVPVDFSLAYGDDMNMGGFSLQIDGHSTVVTSPGKGDAPQMICVPAGWKWPKEFVRIDVAYPDFGKWGANYTSSEWYNNPVKDQVIGNN